MEYTICIPYEPVNWEPISFNTCVCGRELSGTSCSPWSQVNFDNLGNVLRGTCVHGVYFDYEQKSEKITIKFDEKKYDTEGFYLLMRNGKVRCLQNNLYEIDKKLINILIENDIPFTVLNNKRREYFPFLEP